ncbi:MAG: hypothetical protein ABJN24_11630 [Hyphomicrobiales bacterium]
MTKTTKTITGIVAGLAIGSFALGSAHTANAFTVSPSGLNSVISTSSIEPVHFISKRPGKRSDYYPSARGYKGLLGFRGEFIGSGGAAKHGYNGAFHHFEDDDRHGNRKNKRNYRHSTSKHKHRKYR